MLIAQKSDPFFYPLDEHKTIAIAENVLSRIQDKEANYMYLLKLIFFADRYHIRKYLRPATSDRYIAMKRGAVASYLCDICRGDEETEGIEPIGNFSVRLVGEPRYQDELSESDKEAIDFALEKFQKYSEFALSDISHAYPEWKKYEKQLFDPEETKKSFAMHIEDFLLDADPEDKMFRQYDMVDPYEPISDEEREILKNHLYEMQSQVA
jgi:uncharacterized phage-associated protein